LDSRKYIKRFISDVNGNVIGLVYDDTISVVTIDKNGKEINRHNLFPHLDHWEGMGIYYDITTCGEYFAVLVNEYTPVTQAILRRTPLRGHDKGKEIVKKREFHDGKPNLFLFNSNGDLLYEKRCEGNKAEKVVITNSDYPIIIVTTVDIRSEKELTEKVKTNVFDLNLNFLYSLPVRSIRYCIIDSLVIISYRDLKNNEPVLSAFAINNGTKIWTVPLEQFPFFIYANDDSNEIHLLSASQPTFDDPIERFFLRSYNAMGVKLSDDFLGVELNHTGLGYNSREYVWGKSLYVINNKIYIKQ